jgi:hypothetical protein
MGGGGEWLTPRPGLFTSWKSHGINCIEGWVGARARNIPPPPWLEPPTIQPAASRYTDFFFTTQCLAGNNTPLLCWISDRQLGLTEQDAWQRSS